MSTCKQIFFLCYLSLNLSLLGVEYYKYSGTALDLKTMLKLYFDNHTEKLENGRHIFSEIEYTDPTGKVFAKKKINFQKNPTLPDFILEDFRDGYIEGAEVKGREIRVFYRKSFDSEMEEKTFPIPENPVVDGGVDYFIKANWNKLLEGKKLNFNMFAPSKLNYYKLRVVKTKLAEFKGKKALYLKIDLDIFLINIFLPSIIVVYDLETKRIVYYEGISNINDEKGKSYFVKISYNHSEKK